MTVEQQKRIEHWLFTEHLSYAQTHARMREELRITCALSTIGPMYRHLKESRSNEREAILQKLTEVITEPGADIDGIRAGSLAVISKRLLDRAMARDNSDEIVALGRVMLRGEGREIQRDRVELARQSLALRRWEAVRKCGGPPDPGKHPEKAIQNRLAKRNQPVSTGLDRDKPG